MADSVRHSSKESSARVPASPHLHATLRESNDMNPAVREMLHINEERRRCYEQAGGAKESEVAVSPPTGGGAGACACRGRHA